MLLRNRVAQREESILRNAEERGGRHPLHERVQGVCTQLALYTHTHCKGEHYCSKPMEEARSSHSEKGGAADGGEGACTAGEGRGMDTAPLVINK